MEPVFSPAYDEENRHSLFSKMAEIYRTWPDHFLSESCFSAHRIFVPLCANLFIVWSRMHFPVWIMGWRMDGIGQNLPMQPVWRIGP